MNKINKPRSAYMIFIDELKTKLNKDRPDLKGKEKLSVICFKLVHGITVESIR